MRGPIVWNVQLHRWSTWGDVMTKAEIRFFRERLEQMIDRAGGKESVLRGELFGVSDEPLGRVHEQYADDDMSREESEQEIGLTLLSNERELSDECHSAINRIEHGTYGVCESCSKPIAKHRLMALPYARACMACSRK